MTLSGFRFLALVVSLIVLALSVRPVCSQTILIDDFSDGNDDGWLRIEDFVGAAGPGIFDASTGSYNLKTTNAVAVGSNDGVSAVWEASAEPFFQRGTWRAKVAGNTMGPVFGLAVGTAEDSDDGFYFFGTPAVGEFRYSDCLSVTGLCGFSDTGIPCLAGEEYNLELGVADNSQDTVRISMKVWHVDENEPPLPQATRLVRNFPTSGYFAVGGWTSSAPGYTSPVIFDTTYDDIYFTPIPEPSSALLIVLGFLGLAVQRRFV